MKNLFKAPFIFKNVGKIRAQCSVLIGGKISYISYLEICPALCCGGSMIIYDSPGAPYDESGPQYSP